MASHDDVLDFGAKSKAKFIIGGVVGTLAVVVIVAVVVGVVLNPPFTSFPLPSSAKGQLLRLVRTDVNRPSGDPLAVARSYDGYPWENIPDLDFDPVDITCDNSGCKVNTKGSYKVVEVEVPAYIAEATDQQQLSRFLLQSTFGASKAYLQSVSTTYKNDYLKWITDQVDLPPTLLRDYFRQRANPRQAISSDVGNIYQPCEVNSRWHTYSFNTLDEADTLVVSSTEVNGAFTLRIDGILRTEVTTFLNVTWPGTNSTITFPARYVICRVNEGINATITLTPPNNLTACNIIFQNPAVTFSSIVTRTTRSLAANTATFTPIPFTRNASILTQLSINCSLPITGAFFQYQNVFYRFDPRLKFIQNTLDKPAESDANSLICPSVVRTFVNEEFCIRRPSCAPLTFSSAPVSLDNATLQAWYIDDSRYVYYITGLRLEDPYSVSPCTKPSRWSRTPGACPTPSNLDNRTYTLIFGALSSSNDTNPYVRDIDISGSRNCTAPVGTSITVGNECFQQVHPDHLSVRDATYWSTVHDGNQIVLGMNLPNPIAKWAAQGLPYLRFPASHGMVRWSDRVSLLPSVGGRYGDVIDFRSLPVQLQSLSMATRVNAIASRGDEGYEVCGSPGESGNKPLLGNRYMVADLALSTDTNSPKYRELDFKHNDDTGKSMVWTNVVLTANDQLRQRVAWTLSQIFTCSAINFGRDIEIEPWTNYYDIFVRNAFGNYRNIMKEVSYSPLMGGYLSYYQNKAYSFGRTYPDENYAREIMQLFSIGLWKLNDDGTQATGPDGNPMPTYTNDDIVDFARVWTGFDSQQRRSNAEQVSGLGSINIVDPMQIKPIWRDLLPKAKLDDGYLGDVYPLCDSLPPQHWLKEGAKYTLTGANSIEGRIMDLEWTNTSGYRGRFAPAPTSELYKRLCSVGSNGRCTFPDEVVITTNIQCAPNSVEEECLAGRVLTVKVTDSAAGITRYYTYESVPCVRLTFYQQGKAATSQSLRQCVNPVSSVAMPVCCNKTIPNRVIENNTAHCLFANEAMDYNTAKSRCENAGYAVCNGSYTGTATWFRTCAESQYQWLTSNCTLQVQVYSSGQIAVVDPISSAFVVLRLSGNNVFRVRWNNGAYPKADNGCDPACREVATSLGDTCVCNISVSYEGVFTDPEKVPSPYEIKSSLFIGAAKPSTFNGAYSKCATAACGKQDKVTVWLKDGVWSNDTIFELASDYAGYPPVYYANIRSVVSVGDSFAFRNPPHFMPLTGELTPTSIQWSSDALWLYRAEQETEAVLDHLFFHNSTAPFVAYRYIQRMVTSNPSPRYMKSVVNAFRTGTYNGRKFSGKYGDLLATVTAVLLDPEARSNSILVDPSFGQLREPLLKVIHTLRALEYRPKNGLEVGLHNTDMKIGQEAFNAPSVFGYYLPENRPAGPITNHGLCAPEAQIGVPPVVIGYLNGMASLIDNGLTACSFGLGNSLSKNCGNSALINQTADGSLQYTPAPGASPADVIQELDLLLTSGRLNPDTREYFTDRYTRLTSSNTTAPIALKIAQKLFTAVPEFHSTAANVLTNDTRPTITAIKSLNRKFKAIVVIFQNGGCDSYNLLVPLGNCSGAKDMYAEYQSIRGLAALDKTAVLPIQVPTQSQVCDTFGVHPSMPNLRNLYNRGDAVFLSNIGALIEPLTKLDYFGKSGVTKRFPPSLFAHNIMQRSMHNLDPRNIASKGILGRTITALQNQADPWKSDLYSLMGTVKMLEGTIEPDYIDANSGVTVFNQYDALKNDLNNMTEFLSESAFGETYARILKSSIDKTNAIAKLLQNTTLLTNFTAGNNGVARQFLQVAKLIKMRSALQTERAVFVTQRGGYDTHATFNLNPLFGDIDVALGLFEKEMTAQGIWDDVVVLSVSEFGRTLTANGAGTDHAWAGNHFLAGGGLKGGRILGTYPDKLTDDGAFSLGRGRMLPSSSWESVWKAIVQWFGVQDNQLAQVLPNLKYFPADQVYSSSQLFQQP